MDEQQKREIDALLEFIRSNKNTLMSECRSVSDWCKMVLQRKPFQGYTNDPAGDVHAPKAEDIVKYSEDLDLNSLNGAKKYLDITEYWEHLSNCCDALQQYLSSVMEAHWFLLYYTHRYQMTGWEGGCLPITGSGGARAKQIDELLFRLKHEYRAQGELLTQIITTFLSKVVGNALPLKIVDIYYESNQVEDDSLRLVELEDVLEKLPMVFREAFDSILFTYSSTAFRIVMGLRKYFCVNYVYFDTEVENFDFNFCFITILITEIKNINVLLEPKLNDLKEEYFRNKHLLDNDICRIIDGLFGMSPTASLGENNPKIEECQGPEDSYTLPKNFFDLPIDRDCQDEFFDTESDVEEEGADKFCKLINYIASQGFIENDFRTKRLLTYVLTGRLKPDDYKSGETVRWKAKGGEELCYLVKSIIVSDQGKKYTKYDKMRKLFTGPHFSKKVPDKDLWQNAKSKFQKDLHRWYPTVCKLKYDSK